MRKSEEQPEKKTLDGLAVDPVLLWIEGHNYCSQISCEYNLGLDALLNAADHSVVLHNKSDLDSSVRNSHMIPSGVVMLLVPVHGYALIRIAGEIHLLERGVTCLLVGPVHYETLTSGRSLEQYVWATSDINVSTLVDAGVIGLSAGDHKIVRNGEIRCPVHQGVSESPLHENTSIRDVLLAILLVSLASRTSRESTFCPKVPESLSVIDRLLQEVWENPKVEWSLTMAAQMTGYSHFHFSRIFRSAFVMGFREYVMECRVRKALEMICNSGESFASICDATGFLTASTFRNSLKSVTGFTLADVVRFVKN